MTSRTEQSPKSEGDSDATSGPPQCRSFTLALCDRGGEEPPEVAFLPGFNAHEERLSAAGTRISILYPLDCAEFRLPVGPTFGVLFLAPRFPLAFLSDLDQATRKLTLFGCGLCSVVIVSEHQEVLDTVLNNSTKLYAWERWDIHEGRIVQRRDNTAPSTPELLGIKNIRINLSGDHADSTVWLLNELFLNFNRFYQDAQRQAPYVVKDLEALADDVNELIKEIQGDEGIPQETYHNSTTTDQSFPEQEHNAFLVAKKRLNSNLDLLVQLNSALVYALTQAFAGAVPIRQRFPLISQHSLLGTGSAWRAIHRICSTTFGTFREARAPETLRERLDGNSAVTQGAQTDPQQEISELRLNTRVVHFSARNGFGESDAAITCPSQPSVPVPSA